MFIATQSNWLRLTSLLCTALLVPGELPLMAQGQSPAPAAETAKPIPADQLDSLVAPIALYPDPLLAQVLVASTYPLELIQLQQWLAKHKDLKDKALVDAVQKEKWDPSIQAMAALPDVVKQLAENIKWTSELGDAFLAQQSDVMDAVQRMRAKAQSAGHLKSNEQMKVETKVVENKSVVIIEQANPQVVYVPSYDPVVVWGAPPVYAYPPYYPPAGYYAAGVALSFGVGLAMGAAWGGGWGYNSGWGGNNNININNNNNFVNNSNRANNVGSGNRGGNSNWQHNPQHRGAAPYGDRSTANKFGGTARGESARGRQAGASQRAGNNANSFAGNRGGAGGGGIGDRQGAGGGNRGGSRGSDSIGGRQTSGGAASSRGGGAFGGASGGGGSARSSSSRGASSFGGGGSRGGGGGSRGGGRRR